MERTLPRQNAEPGPWRSARTPYCAAVYEAVADPRYKRIVGVFASQSGKTELLINLLGHRLCDDPGPVLFIGASQRQVESISAGRVDPMVNSTASLKARLDRRKSRNKVTEKFFAGARLGFGWAGSAIELSSHPCCLVLLDERDRMASDVAGEGDPVALAEARVATYPDGKIVVTSSPTVEGASPIWTLWQSGTAARWSWPCPECERYFVPEFKLLQWPQGSTPSQARKAARLTCPNCGALIEDRQKVAMNAAGRYEITGDPESDTASFWVSGLCSPWRSWGDAARRWLEAYRSGEQETMQAVTNTVFGELWRIEGEAPPAAKVAELRGGYSFDQVPEAARGLTAGVDVQADRLVYVVRAWGASQTSWLIRHGELYGDTLLEDVWTDLAALLEAHFGTFRIRMTLIDSGYRPDRAYNFARRFPGRVLPAKGHDQGAKPVYLAKLDVNVRGEPQRRGVRLAHIDSSYFKSWIHGRIAWPQDQPGAWHLPIDVTDDYCAQLVSEQRIAKPNGAVAWVKTRTANHFLDAEVLATAAAHLLQVPLLREKPAADADDQGEPGAVPPKQSRPPKTPAQRRPNPFSHGPGWQGGQRPWVSGWRR